MSIQFVIAMSVIVIFAVLLAIFAIHHQPDKN
jgi:hypothetical protein